MVDLTQQLERLAATATAAANVTRGKGPDAALTAEEIATITRAFGEIWAIGKTINKFQRRMARRK